MKIICIGDSLTEGYPFFGDRSWPAQVTLMEGWEMVNLGISGQTAEEILARTVRKEYFRCGGTKAGSEGVKADMAVILAGSNDFIYTDRTAEEVFADIQKIAEDAASEGIIPVIGTPTLCLPEQASVSWTDSPYTDYEAVNRKLRELAGLIYRYTEECAVKLLDFQEVYKRYGKYVDGLHPTEEGYRLMAEFAKEELKNDKEKLA